MIFSDTDIKTITAHGLKVPDIEKQISDFKSGFPYANIIRPATIGDGIMELSPIAQEKYINIYKNQTGKVTKFVPASGAATRMFKDLFEYLSSDTENKTTTAVLNNLNKFAFYDDLQRFITPTATNHDIINAIVNDCGLNYGKQPKALVKFHKYSNGARTAAQEQLVEGAQYATCNDTVNIHFTLSPEHLNRFNELMASTLPQYEHDFNVKYNVTTSTQKQSTDTIAVTPDNEPFRQQNGELLFRPSGHGALIENLNDIDSDIIFIKNIDNVCHDAHRADTIKYKQILAGVLIDTQRAIFKYMRDLSNNNFNASEIADFITHTLNHPTTEKSRETLMDILNRPLRVCGVVKNSGAPGGGPFWTISSDGTTGLQIVESAQIAPDQRGIMEKSTHFNPVDLVCGTRDWHGNKFDLAQFIDTSTGFISDKSANGNPLRAMERPGLWNGAMAYWHTILVAVPQTTFTPVKVVSDLLLPPHNDK